MALGGDAVSKILFPLKSIGDLALNVREPELTISFGFP